MSISEAEAAAQIVARRWGEPKVMFVRDGSNAVFVSARLAFRVSSDLAKSIRTAKIATILADLGFPAVPAKSESPDVVGDLAVTVWERADDIDLANVDMKWLGATLRLLHNETDRLPIDVLRLLEPFPTYERRRFFGRLDRYREAGGDAAIADELAERFNESVTGLIDVTGERVFCHGDPHRTNVMRFEGKQSFIDWDDVTLAPSEFDLGRVTLQQRFGQPEQDTNLVLSEYGAHDKTALGFAQKVCEMLNLSWVAELSIRRPEVIGELAHRMKTIDEPSDWLAF